MKYLDQFFCCHIFPRNVGYRMLHHTLSLFVHYRVNVENVGESNITFAVD